MPQVMLTVLLMASVTNRARGCVRRPNGSAHGGISPADHEPGDWQDHRLRRDLEGRVYRGSGHLPAARPTLHSAWIGQISGAPASRPWATGIPPGSPLR